MGLSEPLELVPRVVWSLFPMWTVLELFGQTDSLPPLEQVANV